QPLQAIDRLPPPPDRLLTRLPSPLVSGRGAVGGEDLHDAGSVARLDSSADGRGRRGVNRHSRCPPRLLDGSLPTGHSLLPPSRRRLSLPKLVGPASGRTRQLVGPFFGLPQLITFPSFRTLLQ